MTVTKTRKPAAQMCGRNQWLRFFQRHQFLLHPIIIHCDDFSTPRSSDRILHFLEPSRQDSFPLIIPQSGRIDPVSLPDSMFDLIRRLLASAPFFLIAKIISTVFHFVNSGAANAYLTLAWLYFPSADRFQKHHHRRTKPLQSQTRLS